MGQDWGAAEPLRKYPQRVMEIYDRLSNLSVPSFGKRQQPYDDRADRATETFRKAAEARKAAAARKKSSRKTSARSSGRSR